MSKPFHATLPLRFAHCDPAGIAYYPRLFELCDAVIEDWTAAVIGVDRRTMHLDLGLGLPMVDLRADFTAMSRLGDPLDFALAVQAVGGSSVDFGIEVHCRAERRFGVQYRQVLVRFETGRAEPWPDEWRTRLKEARLVEAGQ